MSSHLGFPFVVACSIWSGRRCPWPRKADCSRSSSSTAPGSKWDNNLDAGCGSVRILRTSTPLKASPGTSACVVSLGHMLSSFCGCIGFS